MPTAPPGAPKTLGTDRDTPLLYARGTTATGVKSLRAGTGKGKPGVQSLAHRAPRAHASGFGAMITTATDGAGGSPGFKTTSSRILHVGTIGLETRKHACAM